MSGSPLDRALFALLLLMYPQEWRDRHGTAMVETFLEDLEGRDRLGRAALRLRAVVDALRYGSMERIDSIMGPAARIERSAWTADIALAIRGLRRHPGPAVAGVAALGLGIGLTATAFSIVYGTLLRPLPFTAPEELVSVTTGPRAARAPSGSLTHGEVQRLRAGISTVDAVASWATGIVSLGGGERVEPEFVGAALVEPGLFSLLGIAPAHGRMLNDDDGGPSGPKAVLLGHDLWLRRWGGDPDVLGRTLRVNVRRFSGGWSGIHTVEVVGILPERFSFPVEQQLWLPLGPDPGAPLAGDGSGVDAIVRLREGTSIGQFQAELDRLNRTLGSERGAASDRVLAAAPYRDPFATDRLRTILLLILAGGVGVLVVACANVSNLLLMKASAREGDLAVMRALGAGRWTLVRQVLVDALVLTVVASSVGLLLGSLGVKLFDRAWSRYGSTASWWDLRLDLLPSVAVLVVVIAVTLLIAALPAYRALSADAISGLRRTGRSTGHGRAGGWLVVLEVAATAAILIPTGLTVTSVLALAGAYDAIDSDVLTTRIGLWEADYPTRESRQLFWTGLHERLRGLPGVETAALASALPMDRTQQSRIWLEGSMEGSDGIVVHRREAGPGYFATMGVQLLAGRDFESQDARMAPPVALVNASFADDVLRGGTAVGRQFRVGGEDAPLATIVGVVPDLWADGPADEEPAAFYLPIQQTDPSYLNVLVRTSGDPLSFEPAVRAAITDLDPDLATFQTGTVESYMREQTWRHRVYAGFFAVFGAAAFLLSVLGVYAVVGFAVGRQTRELGLRLALGAQGHQVVVLVVRRVLLWLGMGLAVGVPVALWLSRGLAEILFEVRPGDPIVVLTVVFGLLVAAIAAACVPARRAARVDPTTALATN